MLWKLFGIWSTPQAAARAEPAVLAEVEKLLQPLGLFRKRTVAIKRLSQEYLETQVASAPCRCAGVDGVSLCVQQTGVAGCSCMVSCQQGAWDAARLRESSCRSVHRSVQALGCCSAYAHMLEATAGG